MSATPGIYLIVRRKKTTIFVDAREGTTVLELKKIIHGITKVSPEDQKLYSKNNQTEMEDDRILADYGYLAITAKAQSPELVSLTYRMDNGGFEDIDITPLSSPPDLPEVMKGQEATHETSN